ncbi:site-2 protease family protein [Natronobacterium gregoryi]|uniref:Membrane-associated Zn-dependent protease n=2 Tax=Natronobacterium gregoryi TaxID=44930 RepID=L0AJG7_NATGS|nr:site-2 protease family protein [Natronobacterium gregoryi]AFZ73584.1 putative membrane-associated Zn-dependent protease [Natronobacterium gregoryi SP2]ELY68146.1 peptidase M50 [Natronobacterium gregoryi SP2]PLK20028.1 PDZ domain-containing protein [Natronobacterium gregoryi SP2]SFJ34951.1 PDZ domain-containing protein [Natronobacterium gregoryi]
MDYGFVAAVSLPELFGSELLTWAVVGLAIYWAGIIALRKADLLPEFVGAQGPILTFHTTRGREFLDWLSGPKRFWRAWANVGIGISLVVMVTMFGFLLLAAVSALSAPQPTEVQQPQNVLVIPGVNDFLPLSATPGLVFGLLVGLVVHEGGHGLLCRVEDIDIESMGIAMLAIIPFGAFVEPDQKSSKEASRGGQTRMFAAGVTNNFAITLVAFALLFGPIAGSIAVAPGAAVGGVEPGTPADDAGIEPSDRITAVEGVSIDDNEELADQIEATDTDRITVELNGERPVDVDRSLLVSAAVDTDAIDLERGDVIAAVDGQEVATEGELIEAVGEDDVATLAVDAGDGELEREVPIGALVEVADGGPLDDAGAPTGQLIITAFDGERVHSEAELNDRLATTDPGDEASIAGYLEGDRVEYDVTLGDRSQVTGGGTVGFHAAQGVSGFSAEPLGVQLYPAEEYLAVLGGDGESSFGAFADSFLGKIGIAILLPIIGVFGTLPFNFAGFTSGIENFYQVQGSFAAVGDSTVFVLANLLFWTGWINVQLGFFNCIPAFPLDGGHILRTSTEAVVSRLPIEGTRRMVRLVTTSVGLTMLFSFLAMLFAPPLLAG